MASTKDRNREMEDLIKRASVVPIPTFAPNLDTAAPHKALPEVNRQEAQHKLLQQVKRNIMLAKLPENRERPSIDDSSDAFRNHDWRFKSKPQPNITTQLLSIPDSQLTDVTLKAKAIAHLDETFPSQTTKKTQSKPKIQPLIKVAESFSKEPQLIALATPSPQFPKPLTSIFDKPSQKVLQSPDNLSPLTQLPSPHIGGRSAAEQQAIQDLLDNIKPRDKSPTLFVREDESSPVEPPDEPISSQFSQRSHISATHNIDVARDPRRRATNNLSPTKTVPSAASLLRSPERPTTQRSSSLGSRDTPDNVPMDISPDPEPAKITQGPGISGSPSKQRTVDGGFKIKIPEKATDPRLRFKKS